MNLHATRALAAHDVDKLVDKVWVACALSATLYTTNFIFERLSGGQ